MGKNKHRHSYNCEQPKTDKASSEGYSLSFNESIYYTKKNKGSPSSKAGDDVIELPTTPVNKKIYQQQNTKNIFNTSDQTKLQKKQKLNLVDKIYPKHINRDDVNTRFSSVESMSDSADDIQNKKRKIDPKSRDINVNVNVTLDFNKKSSRTNSPSLSRESSFSLGNVQKMHEKKHKPIGIDSVNSSQKVPLKNFSMDDFLDSILSSTPVKVEKMEVDLNSSRNSLITSDSSNSVIFVNNTNVLPKKKNKKHKSFDNVLDLAQDSGNTYLDLITDDVKADIEKICGRESILFLDSSFGSNSEILNKQKKKKKKEKSHVRNTAGPPVDNPPKPLDDSNKSFLLDDTPKKKKKKQKELINSLALMSCDNISKDSDKAEETILDVDQIEEDRAFYNGLLNGSEKLQNNLDNHTDSLKLTQKSTNIDERGSENVEILDGPKSEKKKIHRSLGSENTITNGGTEGLVKIDVDGLTNKKRRSSEAENRNIVKTTSNDNSIQESVSLLNPMSTPRKKKKRKIMDVIDLDIDNIPSTIKNNDIDEPDEKKNKFKVVSYIDLDITPDEKKKKKKHRSWPYIIDIDNLTPKKEVQVSPIELNANTSNSKSQEKKKKHRSFSDIIDIEIIPKKEHAKDLTEVQVSPRKLNSNTNNEPDRKQKKKKHTNVSDIIDLDVTPEKGNINDLTEVQVGPLELNGSLSSSRSLGYEELDQRKKKKKHKHVSDIIYLDKTPEKGNIKNLTKVQISPVELNGSLSNSRSLEHEELDHRKKQKKHKHVSNDRDLDITTERGNIKDLTEVRVSPVALNGSASSSRSLGHDDLDQRKKKKKNKYLSDDIDLDITPQRGNIKDLTEVRVSSVALNGSASNGNSHDSDKPGRKSPLQKDKKKSPKEKKNICDGLSSPVIKCSKKSPKETRNSDEEVASTSLIKDGKKTNKEKDDHVEEIRNFSKVLSERTTLITTQDVDEMSDDESYAADDDSDQSERDEGIFKKSSKHVKHEPDEYFLTEEDKEILRNLYVKLDFEVPLLHRLCEKASRPTQKHLKKFEKYHLVIKKGKFTKEEDNILKRNWEEFVKVHKLENNPCLFFSFQKTSRKSVDPVKVGFLKYIARGLEDRTLCKVYERFKVLYRPTFMNLGRFTKEEDEQILRYLKTSRSRTVNFDLAKILNRTTSSIEKRIQRLTKYNYDRTLKWTNKRVQIFLKALLKVTKCDTVEQLRYRTVTLEQWKKLSEELDDIPLKRLSYAWERTIYPRLFIEDHLNMRDVKIGVVKRMYKRKETDWKTVDWNRYASKYPGLTGVRLYATIKNLVDVYVSVNSRGDLAVCLEVLYRVVTNGTRLLCTYLRKLVYEDGVVKEARRV